MNIEIVKEKLNPKDIKSLLYWQKVLNLKIEEYDKEDEIPSDDLLDLYDFIMHKIAWNYINSIES